MGDADPVNVSAERLVTESGESALLTERYDKISGEVCKVLLLREDLLRRSGLWGLMGPLLGPRAAIGRTRRSGTLAVGPQRCELMRRAARREQIADANFELATSPYWLEEMAGEVLTRHRLTAVEVDALRKIHEAREKGVEALERLFGFRTAIAALITAFGLLATQLPKEAYNELGWSTSYGKFRLALFIVLIFVVGYLGLSSLPASRQVATDRACFTSTGLMLMYCSLLSTQQSDSDAERPGRGLKTPTAPARTAAGPPPGRHE